MGFSSALYNWGVSVPKSQRKFVAFGATAGVFLLAFTITKSGLRDSE